MTEQKPSVGRIVHYVSQGSADGRYPSVCRAAIVTTVDEYQNSEPGAPLVGHIGVAVLNPQGIHFNTAFQNEERDAAGKCQPGTWHWPERV